MKLALRKIGHSFLGRTVFENLDLSLDAGEVVALVGPSGCGKTTVLQIAAGLLDPMRGRVHRDYTRHAVVFQEPRLMSWMTTRDNIAYGPRAAGQGKLSRTATAERRAREVGLEFADLDKYPAELSLRGYPARRAPSTVARPHGAYRGALGFRDRYRRPDIPR